MVDWFTTTITATQEGLPMITLSIRDWVRNAAAVFSGSYGSVTHRAQQAGCSRQTLYDQARRIEDRLEPVDPVASTPAPDLDTTPTAIDHDTRVRFAVTAFALGISTRQIEALIGILAPDDGPDHSTIGRWVAHHAQMATEALAVLDLASAPHVEVACCDEVFFGGGRLWSSSNLRAWRRSVATPVTTEPHRPGEPSWLR